MALALQRRGNLVMQDALVKLLVANFLLQILDGVASYQILSAGVLLHRQLGLVGRSVLWQVYWLCPRMADILTAKKSWGDGR